MNMIGLRLLLATVLVGSALSGCAFLSPFTSCKGTGPAVAELDELPALELHPPGATPVDGGAADGATCTDDSGDAWLTADRLYVYDGSEVEVVAYYVREMAAAGWHPGPRVGPAPQGRIPAPCFESPDRPSVRVIFESPAELREFYQVDPGPEPTGSAPRTWFVLSAEASPDGSRMDC
ncbi:hypothetical protein ACWGF3_02135 [Streptomyces xanthophaeus]|uniref:Lipoprotein n=1 Tax=Streptomyces xanthophaeus TaxID=67385 RepID=A0A919LCI5_9ACTN|nr:hypothetical protein [Streptomyces xanthophaeus]GHI85236.1 hypothetical protein Sxan_26000 [Streptomyces xanthophaeus]